MDWELLRCINFVILFISFMVMIYKGALQLMTYKKSFNWDRFQNVVWTVLALWSISEVLFMHTPGGPRVFLQTLVAIFQLYVCVFHFTKAYNPTSRLDDRCYNPLEQKMHNELGLGCDGVFHYGDRRSQS